jgi:hypothetical protein
MRQSHVPLAERDRRIRTGRDVSIRLSLVHQNPLVERGVLVEDLVDVGLGGAVVCDAEFPIRVELRAHRLDGLAQEVLRCVEHGKDDGYEWPLVDLVQLRQKGASLLVVHGVVQLDPQPVAGIGPYEIFGLTRQRDPIDRVRLARVGPSRRRHPMDSPLYAASDATPTRSAAHGRQLLARLGQFLLRLGQCMPSGADPISHLLLTPQHHAQTFDLFLGDQKALQGRRIVVRRVGDVVHTGQITHWTLAS